MTKLYEFLLTILFLCSCANAILYAGDSTDKYSISAEEYTVFTNIANHAFYEMIPDKMDKLIPGEWLVKVDFSSNRKAKCYSNFIVDLGILRDIAPMSYYYIMKKGIEGAEVVAYVVNWYLQRILPLRYSRKPKFEPILFSLSDHSFASSGISWWLFSYKDEHKRSTTNYIINRHLFRISSTDDDYKHKLKHKFIHNQYVVSYIGKGWLYSAIKIENFDNLIDNKLMLYGALGKFDKTMLPPSSAMRNPTDGFEYSGGLLSPLSIMQRDVGGIYYFYQELKSKYANMSFSSFRIHYFTWIRQYVLLLQYINSLKYHHKELYTQIKKDKAMVFLVQKTYVQYRDLLSDLRTSLQEAIPKTKDGKKKGLYQKVEMILGKMLSDSANDKLIKDLSGTDEFMGDWDIESHIKELKSFGLEVIKIE